MANNTHVDLVKRGANAVNEFRLQDSHIEYLDLSGANLRGVDLRDADLSPLSYDMTGTMAPTLDVPLPAVFEGADLSNAKLQGADFNGANLCGVSLIGAHINGANFREASFNSAILTGLSCRKANFSGARFYNTVVGPELSSADGLRNVVHEGPSALIPSAILSGFPIKFLRGCGVPESIIENLATLRHTDYAFYSCFISYSHADKEFAHRLHDRLQERGVRCWRDEHDLHPGDDISDAIGKAIESSDKLLLCASRHSLTSWWVEDEIGKAMEKERWVQQSSGQKSSVMIPLDLDGHMHTWENGKASQIRSRLAANFTGWDSDDAKFTEQFERVIKALRQQT